MWIVRPFEATDIQKFHTVNADPWTATYHNGYYAQYLAQWPDLCYAAQGAFEDNVGAYSESSVFLTMSPRWRYTCSSLESHHLISMPWWSFSNGREIVKEGRDKPTVCYVHARRQVADSSDREA